MIPESNQTVANATNTTETRKDKARRFLNKASTDAQNAIAYNDYDTVGWTQRERKAFEELKPIVKAFDEKVDFLINRIPVQEKEIKEIEQQLIEKPVANIKIDFSDNGNFSIIQSDTGAILTTGNKDVIKGVLDGMALMQQATENQKKNK